MSSKTFILLVALFALGVDAAFSQVQYKIPVANIYKEFTNPPPDGIIQNDSASFTGWDPDPSVLEVWQDIISSPQLKSSQFIRDISIKRAHNNNFWATNSNGKNIIFYDEALFEQFKGINTINIDGLVRFSLLHELGHFINHDIEQSKSKQKEIYADNYACGIMCSIHAHKIDVTKVIELLGNPVIDSSYPTKGERLKLIDSFFSNSYCNTDDTQRQQKIDPQTVDGRYLMDGIESLDHKDYPAAISRFNQAIRINKKNENAYYYRGIAKQDSRKYKYEDIIKDFDKAIFLKRTFTLAYKSRGILKINFEHYYEAIEDFNKFFSLNPSPSDTGFIHYNRGYAYFKIDNCKQAIADHNQSDQKYGHMGLVRYGFPNDYMADATTMCNK